MKQTNLIGIVDDTLYIDGLYAGDHYHKAVISEETKKDLISKGVIEFSTFRELNDYYSKELLKAIMGS